MIKAFFAKTGYEVSRIGLGGMPLSIDGRPPEKVALKVIHSALKAGMNLIDTANVYCLDENDIGHNEKLIQKALKEKDLMDKVIIGTKGGMTRPQGRWEVDGRPDYLRQSCEESLQTLNQDSIALYYLHAPDPSVAFEDSLGELIRLQDNGKIEHIGLSNVSLEQLKAAEKMTRIEAVQNRCNPFDQQDLWNSMVDYCLSQNIAYVAYSPVGGRFGKLRIEQSDLFTILQKKYQACRYRIALAWLLSKGPHIFPIPGATRIESALCSAKAFLLKLDSEDCERIDELR